MHRLIVAVLTVEIDEDAAVADAAGGMVEVGHAKWVLHYRAAAREVAGVDEGVTEAENALVAAATGWSVEQEDNEDEEDEQGDGTVSAAETHHL